MHDITNNKHSLTFACPSSRRGPCCGSYHPVSLQTTALLTVISSSSSSCCAGDGVGFIADSLCSVVDDGRPRRRSCSADSGDACGPTCFDASSG